MRPSARCTLSAALWVVSATSLLACATGAALERESDTIEQQLTSARSVGAYRCSPKELAMAEAQLEFLQTELDQGNG